MIEEKEEEEEKEEKESTFRDNELEGESQKIGIFEEKEEAPDYSEVDEVDGDGKPLGPLKVKIDKIFDNTYGDIEHETYARVSFTVDSGFHSYDNPEEKLHDRLLFQQVHDLVEKSKFSVFNLIDENLKHRKLNKLEMNEVFGYVASNLLNIRRIDIFSHLTDYFDIAPAKFYSSLSNKYKNELITELDKATNILEKKKIRKLF
jgi:hypothetical protein